MAKAGVEHPAVDVPSSDLPSRPSRPRVCRVLSLVFVLASCTLGACSSSAAPASSDGSAATSTADPTSAVDAAVISAWKAAENAFYQAEANPQGLFSPALTATMVDPELELVKKNLAADETLGDVGRGGWSLGPPQVVSLGPNENQPTTAQVTSCIDDTQILVDSSGTPVQGVGGSPDWIGATSTMVLDSGGWRLSQQSAVVNASRSVACAGIGS